MSTQLIESWSSIGINVNPNSVNVKALCPACSETRKNKREKCLSVSPAQGVANCHNCGEVFLIKQEKDGYQKTEYTKPEVRQLPVSDKIIEFFKTRGIERSTLEYFKITESNDWMYEKGDYKEGNTPCINFNYFQDSELINVKFRASGKRFRMVKGSKLIFYNLDAIKDSDWCAIQEGEIDTMAAYQCGVYKSISVPNGASKGNLTLEYFDNCVDYFKGKKKIIIATDNDAPGVELGNELIRRLGRYRCYTVEWPEGCKDTNDVLLKLGPKAVKSMYDNAKPFPLVGVVTGEDLSAGIMDFYNNGFPKGLKIGHKGFDELFSFRGGELTVVTGIPGSGKSDFCDHIMVRLAARFGWRMGLFSPENQPSSLHAMSLISKFTGEKTFGRDKLLEMRLRKGIQFIDDYFYFMKVDEIDITIDGIIDLAKELVLKKGIKVLLIDPYNYIEHRIPKGYSETQYISELLTKLCIFLKQYDVHGFLIAHPVKIQKDKKTGLYNVATPYDVAGCHDDQTEVLTDRGWIKHEDLISTDKVACYDLVTNNIAYEIPSYCHKYPYKGDIIHFSGRTMDIAVTPNHRMVVKPSWALKPETEKKIGRAKKYESRGWQFIDAEKLSKSPTIMPKSGEMIHSDLLPDEFPLDNGYRTNHLFSLIGWFVSEGSESQNSISICQRIEGSDNLRRVILDLKLEVNETETNYRSHEKPMYKMRVYAKKHPELVKFILSECSHGSQNVKLPSMIWLGNEYQKRLLFDALIEGDGSISGKGYKYHTCSKSLADDVSRLAFELGFSVTQRKYEKIKSHWMDRYVVYINPKKTEWLMPVNHKTFFYEGFVYCLTVPTGAYVTRRNGNVAITGNSAHFFNKAYNCLSVYRNFETNLVTVYVQKVKYKFIGKIGAQDFIYDISTGRYAEDGFDFENELARLIQKQTQVDIELPDPSPLPPPPPLTDFNKLNIGDSFDYKPLKDPAPF